MDKLEINYCDGDVLEMLTTCPSCQEEIEIIEEETKISCRLMCPNCMEYFEVIWLFPFTLDFIDDLQQNADSNFEPDLSQV